MKVLDFFSSLYKFDCDSGRNLYKVIAAYRGGNDDYRYIHSDLTEEELTQEIEKTLPKNSGISFYVTRSDGFVVENNRKHATFIDYYDINGVRTTGYAKFGSPIKNEKNGSISFINEYDERVVVAWHMLICIRGKY